MKRPKLLPYQHRGVRALKSFGGRALLADEMGLGKTIQVLDYLRQNRRRALPAIVVCPASLKYWWEHESLDKIGLRADVIEGTRTPTTEQIPLTQPLTIINYDILHYWVPYLIDLEPQTLVIEECQFIKNRNTKRSRAVRKLAYGVPNVIALSGTPFLNRPYELWTVLNLIFPEAFPNPTAFGEAFSYPTAQRGRLVFRGARNLQKLHRLLKATVMIRRRAVDVLEDLPPKGRTLVPLPMSQPEEYKRAETDFLGWLHEQNPGRARRASRAVEVSRMGYLKRLAAELKTPSTVDWLNDFLAETGEKIVVFAIHQKMIASLRTNLNAESVVIDGQTTGRKRQAAIQEFQNRDNIRLLIGQLIPAGIGHTLTAARYAVFAELDWVPANMTQAEARIHRIGQRLPCSIYYLVARGSIEQKLCELIQRKQQRLNAALDGGFGETFDLLDLLLKELKG